MSCRCVRTDFGVRSCAIWRFPKKTQLVEKKTPKKHSGNETVRSPTVGGCKRVHQKWPWPGLNDLLIIEKRAGYVDALCLREEQGWNSFSTAGFHWVETFRVIWYNTRRIRMLSTFLFPNVWMRFVCICAPVEGDRAHNARGLAWNHTAIREVHNNTIQQTQCRICIHELYQCQKLYGRTLWNVMNLLW